MSELGTSPFRVIEGGGQGKGGQGRGARAELVEIEPAQPGSQLVLPGLSGDRPVLLSVGFDELTFVDFAKLVRSAKVRRVVDIRKFAAFGSRDFRPWLIDELFHEHGVSYQRMFDLGNPFLGTSSNRLLVMKRYEQHVHEHSELVRDLGQRLEESPLLLLGRRAHEDSERAILVAALVRLKFKFDLALAQADGIQVMDPIQRRRSSRHSPRQPGPPARDQVELPFA